MNILGIDFGTKRIGLAWAQSGLGVVLPFGVVDVKRTDPVLAITQIITTEKIDLVVVGLPVALSGLESENAERVRNFATQLQKAAGVPIEFFDERFSSYGADRMGGGASRDEKAAMIILQSYLDKKE